MKTNVDERLQLHRKFWEGDSDEKPLVSFRLGDYFFANKFEAAGKLLKPGLKIEPFMIHVDDFMEDYERHFQTIEKIDQNGFWVADPYIAIPWMEAMLGCSIYAGEHSFTSAPLLHKKDAHLYRQDIFESPWYEKYMEFTGKLVQLSGGRFPIGEPIMRGPSDVIGAILGQTQMIYAMNDEPESIKELASGVTNAFLNVIKKQFEIIPAFYGGNSLGFYHLWTPGKCIWFQEDLSTILSPEWYREFIIEQDQTICENFEYNAVHLHPASFHILDDLLGIEKLKAVEVNKDVGGPSIREMMPVLKKILAAKKRLMLWGTLDKVDLELIMSHLSHKPVFLNIVAETIVKAKGIKDYMEKKRK